MRIQFDYQWYDDEKTVMRYTARDNWNWKDYHAVVRVSLFAFHAHPHPVHMLIDLSTGQRERFPSGLAGHARTFGKRISPNLSGKAVVIGVPESELAKLGITETRTLAAADGTVHFVDTEAEARSFFAAWGTSM